MKKLFGNKGLVDFQHSLPTGGEIRLVVNLYASLRGDTVSLLQDREFCALSWR